ncbi:RDD family protein [Propionicicella superfundia]|uniref:RDD family protein n=1 Tax=Propionicicella superfundia TaxID=348582 RepID=UPI00041DB775|nr:RDD family protein [Propionicicella superfundia]
MNDGPTFAGARLGLPEKGSGSLATWHARIAALVIDWAASMIVASAVFGPQVLVGHDWRTWMVMAVFFVESTVLGAVVGGSFGKVLARIAVVRLDGGRIGWARAASRALMLCLVIPAVVVGADRRALTDVLLGTVVVSRR